MQTILSGFNIPKIMIPRRRGEREWCRKNKNPSSMAYSQGQSCSQLYPQHLG